MKIRTSLLVLVMAALALPAGEALAAHKHHKEHKAKHRVVKHSISSAARKAAARTHHLAKAESLNYADVATGKLRLLSNAVVVQDQVSGTMLFEKNSEAVLPIASITKLMTAMVTLDGHQSLKDEVSIGDDDVDTVRRSTSHVPVGTVLSREHAMRLALMSSENRAAHTLARHFPGGTAAFVTAMNVKAQALGLKDTKFFDPTGLNSGNVSSARDLAKMVAAASTYPLIREFTTTAEYPVALGHHMRTFHNTNALVRGGTWEIGVSKTGFINESGKCLVMQAWFNNKPTIIVLLDSMGKMTRVADAQRIKKWIEANGGKVAKVAMVKPLNGAKPG